MPQMSFCRLIRFKGGTMASNLMRISGVLLVAAAVALALMLKFSSAQMQVLGLTPETVATLLVGGILSLGLGSVIAALNSQSEIAPSLSKKVTDAVEAIQQEEPVTSLPKMDFGKKRGDPASAPTDATPPVVTMAKAVATTSVADTIAALEQAKSDIKTALGGVENMATPMEPPTPAYVSPPPVLAPVEPAVEEGADGELFVVEEKIIRGRPSRILSDDTVEAETDEGWMRFENLEHLNEYLDSLEEGNA